VTHEITRREFLVTASCSLMPRVAGAAHGQSSSSWRAAVTELENLIPQLMAEAKVPGLGIALVNGGRLVWRRGFGVRDASSKTPVDNDTVFEAASMSKPPFAYVVLKLCEKGRLDLDSPLTKYTWERFLPNDPRLDLITARQVLSHTSGFQNWRSNQEPLKIHFTPGERYMYSGEGYSYLQSVVAHITGQPLDVYMKANLFVPFDMTSSDFTMTAKLRRHAARPHDEKGPPLDLNTPTGESIARYGAAGGLSTTPSDYARFIIEVVSPKASDPFRLTKASLDDRLRPHVKVNDAMGSSWALGWQVQKTGAINHGGHNRGFQCHAVASAATRSGFVVMTNGEAGASLLEKLLLSDVTNRLL
jgi:CubicO group peptidase (beta-lactamase class C family)